MTKQEKITATEAAAERLATGETLFVCNAFWFSSLRGNLGARRWAKRMFQFHASTIRTENLFNGFGTPEMQEERLMWVCFMLTLLDVGATTLTNV